MRNRGLPEELVVGLTGVNAKGLTGNDDWESDKRYRNNFVECLIYIPVVLRGD
jgi:hypothetical protein